MNEIKIPNGCKSIKIEQESDNRVVITFEPKKQEWKNGDILFCRNNDNYEFIVIFNKINADRYDNKLIYYAMLNSQKEIILNSFCNENNWILATEQQRKNIFAALEKEGYRWNAEKLELEKIEWVPKIGEKCWRIEWKSEESLFFIEEAIFSNLYRCSKLFNKTAREAEALCNKLNAVIN